MAENDPAVDPATAIKEPAMKQQPDLDLTKKKSDDSDLQPAQQYSTAWAAVVKPISWAVIGLLFLLMVIPFLFIWRFPSQVQINIPPGATPDEVAAMVKAATAVTAAQGTKDMLDWAKTFLPSLVGFATAIIGYYFGIRSGTSGQDSLGPASGNTHTAIRNENV